MRIAVYPGSFDPVTLGHLDIIERSSKMVDELVVGVLNNSSKNPLFSVEERVTMLKEVTVHLQNVRVEAFDGLLVDFARQCGSKMVVRGCLLYTSENKALKLKIYSENRYGSGREHQTECRYRGRHHGSGLCRVPDLSGSPHPDVQQDVYKRQPQMEALVKAIAGSM